jgi:hypothetical protein
MSFMRNLIVFKTNKFVLITHNSDANINLNLPR